MSAASPLFTFVGAGAIGGFYGTRFLRAGFSVRFLEPYCGEIVRAEGLHVKVGGQCEYYGRLEVYTRAEAVPPADRVFICLKTTQNDWIAPHLANLVNPHGAIISMQNGLEAERELARFAPQTPLFAAVCFGAVKKNSPCIIEHIDRGEVALAEYLPSSRTPSGLLSSLAAEFRRARISAHAEPDLDRLRWTKLMLNGPLNSLALLLHATTQDLARHPASRALTRSLMVELSAIAAAAGKSLPATLPDRLLAAMDQMHPHETSSRGDLAQMRPLEIESLLRRPAVLAQQLGVSAPKLDLLVELLACLSRPSSSPGPVFHHDQPSSQ